MKTAIFAICFLCATGAAFGQTGSVLSNTASPVQMPDHPQHATEHAMARESSLLTTSSYSYAKGEVPLAELGSLPYETPLGDVARAYRKEHATVAKAVKAFEK
jgi:hypothetical protein